MTMLAVRNLTKRYRPGDPQSGGIADAGFSLAPGIFFSLLGPSGCGKTTTLRCIAGLEVPDAGTIEMGGLTLFDRDRGLHVPMHRRGIGMVFQSYAIWPHMTVFENVAFPLRSRPGSRLSRPALRDRVAAILRRVGLAGYGDRSATRLSGGEQQRVALARAIVDAPRLLLLDEPLSNLDATLREEMRAEILSLQRTTGITTVYVTHDQTEALALSDLIAVVNRGRILQIGTPAEIYRRPETEFVAKFVGQTTLLRGIVLPGGQDRDTIAVDVGWVAPIRCVRTGGSAGEPAVAVSIRPETIELLPDGAATGGDADGLNHARGEVTATTFLGQQTRYAVRVGADELTVVTSPRVVFGVGEWVTMRFPWDSTVAVSRQISPGG
jgi:iron(III) transport system ATP-binding protein